MRSPPQRREVEDVLQEQRSEEHTSELQSHLNLVCRLLLEKKKLGTPNIGLTPILTCDPRKNLAEHQYINASCFTFPTQVGQNGPTTLPVMYGPGYFNTDIGIFKNFQFFFLMTRHPRGSTFFPLTPPF